jgi:Pyruvate/2-oxoacid:ferredoxin oxidoreductase delta subunit
MAIFKGDKGPPALWWDDDAARALRRAPAFVRGLARRKVEERMRAAGRGRVRLADVEEARAAFRAVRGGKSREELAALLPAENRPGVEMVVVEACRARLAQCPNTLLDTEPWQRAIAEWAERAELNERLRRRVGGERVLFHHKLKVALAGCPNGCSRPQIADLAVVGAARPEFDAAACTACGACVEACPDQAVALADTAIHQPELCLGCRSCSEACPEEAVSLGRPFARLYLGGKLGRHPRLALPAGRADEPEQAVEVFSRAVERYLAEAPPGQRFAAWWPPPDQPPRG